MIPGFKGSPRATSRDEGEKPFWISFSDLMTALMVLFLVAMAVALVSVTAPAVQRGVEQRERASEIGSCFAELQVVAASYGLVVAGQTIDFGTRATFPNDSSSLTTEQQVLFRRFVPEVLSIATKPVCKRWLRLIVVEGFASRSGTYLHNLDLSTKRSERVLCTLLEAGATPQLTDAQRELIQNLFFAGGYSFNTIRNTPEESRRIELKLEFYGLDDARESPPQIPLDSGEPCPIDAR
jgi:outer membrane protein OmpA-like peptidoglycan-associated protein